jgi:hypothetical protein
LSAGVIATILFFEATGMVRDHPVALGAAEAMHAAEVLFAVLLGAVFLGEAWPRGVALAGTGVVNFGIGLLAWVVAQGLRARDDRPDLRALRSDRGG